MFDLASWFPDDAPIVTVGRAMGGVSAYARGLSTGSDSLLTESAEGLAAERKALGEALVIVMSAGRGGGRQNCPPIWSVTKNKTRVENAFGHWNKHKAEFPELANAKQYAEAAQSFTTTPPLGAFTKARGSDTLIYDQPTNTFAVRAADGSPRTMFRPADGIRYWNRQ